MGEIILLLRYTSVARVCRNWGRGVMGKSLDEWMRVKQTIERRWPLITVKRSEVSKHSTPGDAWIVLYGIVFDISRYIPYHPGGEETILEYAGCDATLAFRQAHAWVNWERLLDCCIVGHVVD